MCSRYSNLDIILKRGQIALVTVTLQNMMTVLVIFLFWLQIANEDFSLLAHLGEVVKHQQIHSFLLKALSTAFDLQTTAHNFFSVSSLYFCSESVFISVFYS